MNLSRSDSNAATSAEVFRHIFQNLGFPLFSASMRDLSKFVKHPRAEEGSYIDLPMFGVDTNRMDVVRSALDGLVSNINVPPSFTFVFLKSETFKREAYLKRNLLEVLLKGNSLNRTKGAGRKLRWEEVSPWPAAYCEFLSQLNLLIQVTALAIANNISERKKLMEAAGYEVKFEHLDQTSRVQPTRYHYAASSLGSWAGGASNFQFMTYYATAPQMRENAINEDYAQRIDCTKEYARELTESGIVVVPMLLAMPLMKAQESFTGFGGIPIDEFNAVNLPTIPTNSIASDERLPGIFVDKYYRAPFIARRSQNQALYGAKDILRDHYADFYKAIRYSELMRCKHYSVPIVDVDSLTELVDQVSIIPKHNTDGLFFRGQNRLYELTRSNSVRQLLFGSSGFREPSLVTSAARSNFDYDYLHFALRFFINERVFANREGDPPLSKRHEIWRELATSPLSEIDYAIMALAQHYGIPSHGLDVTDSLDVGTWFATNRYKFSGNIARYEKIRREDWPAERSSWPVVFACQQITHSLGSSLQKCQELSELGMPALRPIRQSASFFLGGHGDHQNRLAETVICVFRLNPGTWETAATYASLFPPPELDASYQAMLDFSTWAYGLGISANVPKFLTGNEDA